MCYRVRVENSLVWQLRTSPINSLKKKNPLEVPEGTPRGEPHKHGLVVGWGLVKKLLYLKYPLVIT